MANPSSLPSSSHHRPPSAFQWPLPPQSELELTIKEILDVYQHDPELLKLVLSAKAEEDKKLAARNTLQVEQARIQQRVMDLDMLRVYHRLPSSMIENGIQQQQQQHATATTTTTTAHPHPPPGAVVYAPLQQQVIARITEAHSPVGAYPHSAHPLCSDYARYPQQPPPPQQQPPTTATSQQQQQQHRAPPQQQSSSTSRLLSKDNLSTTTTTTTTSSPPSKKRPRSSNEKMSHDMVMEALKAKLQRTQQAEAAEKKKRARTLPKPLVTVVKQQQQQQQQQSDSASESPIMPSPRSAKPVLPPIDTSVGRLQASRGPMSSPYIQRLPPFSAAIAQKNNHHHYHPSHSDTTKRRVRSLSPPPFANAH
ncbi:hypothetical protein O0I10_001481 [Lichtheimia ornata]|uniref:Uncharacterized protein n=1 Tax=Lichtheimia ornata TaxID=688661 RepID=A0AAD7VCI2_9FUNG|nr:uncharacterized protein O0I10_001481 [Lichtheimia ornata]KAJ8662520.1 hypothetical protein O0I10_001481 [Lichtheimia ornata]